jgi:hypothetical protein
MIPKTPKKSVAAIFPPLEGELELGEVRMIIALPHRLSKSARKGKRAEIAAAPLHGTASIVTHRIP